MFWDRRRQIKRDFSLLSSLLPASFCAALLFCFLFHLLLTLTLDSLIDNPLWNYFPHGITDTTTLHWQVSCPRRFQAWSTWTRTEAPFAQLYRPPLPVGTCARESQLILTALASCLLTAFRIHLLHPGSFNYFCYLFLNSSYFASHLSMMR